MAPLEERFDNLGQLLDDEQLINGNINNDEQVTTTTNSSNWTTITVSEEENAKQKDNIVSSKEVVPKDTSRLVNDVNGDVKLSREDSRDCAPVEQVKQNGFDKSVQQSKMDEANNDSDSMKFPCKFEDHFLRANPKFKHDIDMDCSHPDKKKRGSTNMSHSSDGSDEEEQPTILERAAKVIPGLGVILALCASFSLGTAGMLVKMTHSVNGVQVAVLRSLIQLVIYTVIIIIRKLSLFPERGEWLPVFGRAFLGATSMCFTYYALNLIPLGDATAIRFSLPIWTLIISYLFLGESCQFSKILAVFVAILGVVLIAKPDDCIYLWHLIVRSLGFESAEEFKIHQHEHEEAREHELEELEKLADIELHSHNETAPIEYENPPEEETSDIELIAMQTKLYNHHSNHFNEAELAARHLRGCLLALASSILLSLSLIALRLAKKTPAEVTIFWLSVLSVVIGNMLLIGLNEWSLPDNWRDVFFILLNGICGSAGQWFITSALKVEQSGIIALARTFDIEVAFLYSAFLLRETIRTTR